MSSKGAQRTLRSKLPAVRGRAGSEEHLVPALGEAWSRLPMESQEKHSWVWPNVEACSVQRCS